jgi:hypothetical protein
MRALTALTAAPGIARAHLTLEHDEAVHTPRAHGPLPAARHGEAGGGSRADAIGLDDGRVLMAANVPDHSAARNGAAPTIR